MSECDGCGALAWRIARIEVWMRRCIGPEKPPAEAEPVADPNAVDLSAEGDSLSARIKRSVGLSLGGDDE